MALNIFKFVKLPSFFMICLTILGSCATFYTPAEKQEISFVQGLSPNDRFEIYEKGLVFDKKTGLEWYAGDVTRLEELGSRYWISQLNDSNPGWRLPTRAELYELNKNGRKYCKTLRLNRDVFWIQNYNVYDLITNIVTSPRMLRFRYGLFKSRHDDGGDYEIGAHILVVRSKS